MAKKPKPKAAPPPEPKGKARPAGATWCGGCRGEGGNKACLCKGKGWLK